MSHGPITPPPPHRGSLSSPHRSILTALGLVLAVLGVSILGVAASDQLGWTMVEASVRQYLGQPPQIASRIDASGRLLVSLDGGLSMLTLPGREITSVVAPIQSGVVTNIQWAPDGQSAAYSLLHVQVGESQTTSEIYLTDFTGPPRLLIGRDQPRASMEAPAWSPDGQSLYFAYNSFDIERPVRRIERYDLSSAARTIVMDGALPAISPDGGFLAAVRTGRSGQSLVIARSDASEPRTMIEPGRFSLLGQPRFSSDGQIVALPISTPANQVQRSSGQNPLGFLGARVAAAHGDPWDVFLIPAHGGELRRLTRLAEDEISIAWSPDDRHLAIFATRGLYVVNRDGRASLALDQGGFSGIDWTR